MSGALDGKTVAVVGASGLCGAATARALAREGASLVLGSRSRETLEALQRELEESGARTLVVGTDVTRLQHLQRLVEVALESFGALDALVYTARASPATLASLEAEAWGASVDINLRGLLYAVGAALPAMLERGGHFVDLEAGAEEDALYRAVGSARYAVLGELEAEFAEKGIHFSTVRPTEMRRCEAQVADLLRHSLASR